MTVKVSPPASIGAALIRESGRARISSDAATKKDFRTSESRYNQVSQHETPRKFC